MSFVVVSESERTLPLMVDYAVTFQNRSGTGSRKGFKGLVTDLEPGHTITINRKINLRPMTTREILPGSHRVEVQINGVIAATTEFEVVGG